MAKKTGILLAAVALCVACAFCFAACGEETDGSPTDSSSSESSFEASVHTVTFVQDGRADIVKTVKEGESLTYIPEPVSEKGYTIVWDRMDFSSVTENITVTTIKTPNVYTITYNLGINKNASLSEKTQSVTYGQPFTLPTPEYNGSAKFLGWYEAGDNGKATDEKVENGTYQWAQDVTIVAVWQEWSGVVN